MEHQVNSQEKDGFAKKAVASFQNDWDSLRSEYDEGVVFIENNNSKTSFYDVAFRDIAFKD